MENLFMSKVRFETLLLTIKLFERLIQKMCFNIFFTNFTFYILQHRLVKIKTFQVPKKSKNTLFYKPNEHKICNFSKIHNQSWQLHCCIIDWNSTIYSQIGALKSPKRPKAFFSTSRVATRNAAFESSNANLGNWNVSSLIDASQSFLKLKLWSPQNV